MKTIFRITIFAFACLFSNSIYAQEQKSAAPQEATANISVANEVPIKPADADTKAVIYFYRIKQFAGSALEPSVFVDDKAVARMDNGRYFGVSLEPGKHTLRMGDKQTGFEIDAKAGQVFYARVSLEVGMWKGHGRLTLLQPEQGVFEIKKVKPLGIDKITERSMVTVYEGSDKKLVETKTETKTEN